MEVSYPGSVIPYSSTMWVLAFSFEKSEPGCQMKHWSDTAQIFKAMGDMRCFTFHVCSVETLVPCFPEGTCHQFPKIQRNPQNPQAAKVKLQCNT